MGNLGVVNHEHVAEVLDLGADAGVGGFDVAADPAPEIDLPAGIEAERVEGVGAVLRRRHAFRDVVADPAGLDLALGIDARRNLAGGDAELGARLADPGDRLLDVEIG